MDILRSFADAITRVLDRFYISSVRKDPESILYMKDPSLNVILALSERAPEFIPYIQGNYADKLTDDVKQAMVKINPNVIEWFPDDEKLTFHVLDHYCDKLSEENTITIVGKTRGNIIFSGCFRGYSIGRCDQRSFNYSCY